MNRAIAHGSALRIVILCVVLCLLLLFLAGCTPDRQETDALPEVVDFNFHVKPILSDRCFTCHGPDEAAREADLRLDLPEQARSVLVSGLFGQSPLVRRISSTDPEERMPPPESNLALSDDEIALLKRWVEQGATYRPHWAFLPPENPARPDLERQDWPRNEIDRFVLARLEREGLTPSLEADRERLLRRVTLDLTGLPPTLTELEAFLSDTTEGAYERAVDRLLDAPHYGEQMAVGWLDVARYADSHGYHADGYRMMWPWRDWVIRSFNDNMPFDEFVTWQLAGDLLPNASREQKLATGFNRNHQMNSEAGIVAEEYRLENVFDRVNTFGKVFLGLTVECARCHDHKYDPIAQKEFFQFAAFFNNIDELGMIPNDGNTGPLLMLPTDEQETGLADVRRRIDAHTGAMKTHAETVKTSKLAAVMPPRPVAYVPLDMVEDSTVIQMQDTTSYGRVSGNVSVVPGVVGEAVHFAGGDYDFVNLPEVGLFERYEPFSITLWVRPDTVDQDATLYTNTGSKNSGWRGYEVFLRPDRRISTRFINTLPHNLMQITTKTAIPLQDWSHVVLTYDGSSRASGIRLFVDGHLVPTEVDRDRLYKSIYPATDARIPLENERRQAHDRPLRLGKSYRSASTNAGMFVGSLDDVRVYDAQLTALEVAGLYGTELQDEGAHREHVLHRHDATYRRMLDEFQALRKEAHELREDVLEVMVMEEMEGPRPTYLLDRGVYDAPLEQVSAGTPEMLASFPDSLPDNRLGLARWLTQPDHPLFARVTVNRFWQQVFGTGLVETPDDFGNQGGLPSHPALLDHLAVTFMESGWDVKVLMRRMVTSATYRQSSESTPVLRERDPENRLLARGPSRRLSAEEVRDQALAASGLLVRTIGGPSVKPYQPEGLWQEKQTFSPTLLRYEHDTGDDLYRRSLYTFIRRTSPPPMMTTFDAPSRSFCMVERQRTSTPLQAFVLMNDPQFIEAARVLAERVLHEHTEPKAQVAHLFRRLTARFPTDTERKRLMDLYTAEHAAYSESLDAAHTLLDTGEFPRDETLDPAMHAALTMVASAVMNHDEAVMKR